MDTKVRVAKQIYQMYQNILECLQRVSEECGLNSDFCFYALNYTQHYTNPIRHSDHLQRLPLFYPNKHGLSFNRILPVLSEKMVLVYHCGKRGYIAGGYRSAFVQL